MNDVSIKLPCGYSTKYKDILFHSSEFSCPVCKIHDISKQECLNMTRNKMMINEINLDLKKNKYEELMTEFEKNKKDPKYFIDESYDRLKREVDLRREEIKEMIDDYHDGLLKKIDMERDLKLKELEERIQKAEPLDLATYNIDKNLDIHSKLEFYTKSKIEIDNGISLVKNIIEDFKEPKFKLASDNINIRKVFGELYSNVETIVILNKDEIDDDSRAEATIQLKINDFSLIKDKNKLRLVSKGCFIRNFEWYISIRINEEDGEMGFYLHCNSMVESNEFSVKVNAELTLLNTSDSTKDLTKFGAHCYIKQNGCGYSKFFKINEILNPINGYYDSNEDSFTLKAIVKAELSQKKEE